MFALYRPLWNLQLSASYQAVTRLGQSEDLGIFSFTYDIGREQSVSGRVVQRSGDTNYYLGFRQSGGRGAEYFLILGDPNARRFTKSLILKAVFPFQIGK
jgi:hypothetical protein